MLFGKNAVKISGNLVDGKYKVKVIDDPTFAPKDYEKVHAGVWMNNEERYIMRFVIVDGEFAGQIFSVYLIEGTLTALLDDVHDQYTKTKVLKPGATSINVMVDTMLEKPFEMYRGIEEYYDANGIESTTHKWYGREDRFRKLVKAEVKHATDII